MPPDLVEQVALVHEACAAMGVPLLAIERYEADDVMGTIARLAAEAGLTSRSSPATRTSFSWSAARIAVYNPRDDGTWYDAKAVEEKFGVRPDAGRRRAGADGRRHRQLKGVPGIGEKGARELIATHGSLEALLAAAPSLPQKRYREAPPDLRGRRRGRAASW